jgi:thiol-disulfide isomerase/thioredoxin
MTAALPTSFRHLALRLLPIACILLLPGLCPAQQATNYCEAPDAVKAELKNISNVNDESVPYQARRKRQLAMLEELLKKYPTNLQVRRRYQDLRQGGFTVDKETLIPEYREQMQKSPNDPVAAYLYARLLVGRQTKEAIEIYKNLLQQAPDFPWSHYHLAEIYTYPNFKDAPKSNEHLKQWMTKCPAALNALFLITRSGDTAMMTATAQSVRARLESSTNVDDLDYWSSLWTLEFKLKPVTEHAQLRQKIAADLKRIREKHPTGKQQLEALKDGYKQAGDKTNQRWAEDELIRLMPKSLAALSIVRTRYYDEHPFPKPEEPEEKRQAYHQALVSVVREWLKQWPDDEWSWSSLTTSLMALEGSANADVEAAYNSYVKAKEQGAGGYMVPPMEVHVSKFYLKRGYNLESVPVLLQKALVQFEHLAKRFRGDDLYPRTDPEDSNLRYVRLEAWPLMAQAYARLKQPDKAREVLAQLAGLSKPGEQNTDAQKKKFASGQTIYWQAVAKVAELEERKLDALTAYQTAIGFRLSKPTGKDELSDNAQRLWKELGGTDVGWQAYLARNEASKSKLATAEVAAWDTKNTALPAFDLTDLQGRKWSLNDLKGKVAFINLWATWCGPCRLELPYVQKLREQMKDKKDVLVLTLNTDEEVGMVEPFMKENKYNFPVLLGESYAESQGVNSIPRNWIVSSDGKIMFEGIGFGNDGEEWLKKAAQMIEKAKGTN